MTAEADQKMLEALTGIIVRHLPGAEVVLYGSRARGTADPDSDFDLLVLTESPAL